MKYYDSMGFESENGIWVRRVDVAALEASVADAIDVLKIFSQDAAMLGYVDAAGWEQFDRLMQRLRKVETSALSDEGKP